MLSEDPHNNWPPARASRQSRNTLNPIRRLTDCSLSAAPNPSKAPIRLHLGDPTLYGNLPPSEATLQALLEALESHRFDGYGPAVGDLQAREAIAEHFSRPEAPICAEQVVLASGCSHALEMALWALADEGDNIMVPRPGFPLYGTLCRPRGIRTRHYRLRMAQDGLADLEHMERQIDARTRAILVNNPGNPTGVVLPKWHLERILQLANKYKIPVIADEVYGDLVHSPDAQFHPMASLRPRVPLICCDGIAKRYVVPGWRLGWLIVHDANGVLAQVKSGICALSQKIVGPCALIQGALPRILRDTPPAFFDPIKRLLASNAQTVVEQLGQVPGLRPLPPQGAMYIMVAVDPQMYGPETSFVRELVAQESVYCLPGSAFSLRSNWFRLVLTVPEQTMREACQRIGAFCARNALNPRARIAQPIDQQEEHSSSEEEEGSEQEQELECDSSTEEEN